MTNDKQRYLNYWIWTTRDIFNGMYDVLWEPIDHPDQRMTKGPFVGKDNAIRHAMLSIDDHLESLKQLGIEEQY